MGQRIRNLLGIIIISFLTVALFYLYFPLSWLDKFHIQKPIFGSTITTILGSDTLSSSRTVINTNFSNLNTDKIEATQATLNSLTSATSLGVVGTITGGTWHGNTVTVPYGGTGSTTLAAFNVLIGSSTNPVDVVKGLGTSGQFLTSQGAGLPPHWTTSAVDLAGTYAWTGAHSWTQILVDSSTGTSTFTGGLYTGTLIGAPYFDATSTTATSTFSGGIVMTSATTTDITVSNICHNCIKPVVVTNSSGACSTTADNTCTVTASCTAPRVVIAGGGIVNTSQTAVATVTSIPTADNTGWIFTTNNMATANAHTITAYAVCVNP